MSTLSKDSAVRTNSADEHRRSLDCGRRELFICLTLPS